MLSPGRFALGALELAVVAGAAWLGASALRSRFAPAWRGIVAGIADAVIALSLIVVVEQALGTFGLLREGIVVLTIAAIGVSLRWLFAVPREQKCSRCSAKTTTWRRVTSAGAVVAVAVTVGQWAARIGSVLDGGITSFDSLHYHLPFAARFAQTGSAAHIQLITPEFPDAYHHANAELLHALGMLFFHRDVLSVFLNLGFVALAVAGAYCLGERWGDGPLAVIGLCVVLASPLMGLHHAGTATNDVVVLAFVLAAAALLVQPDGGVGGFALVGLAAGMAFGTKLTALAVAAMLVLGIAVLARRGRRAVSVAWASLAAAIPSAYWLVRNLVDTGNPAPGVSLPFFTSDSFRTLDDLGYPISHYLTATDVWRDWFFPGLRIDFGRTWPIVIVVAACGTAAALLSRDTRARVLGVATAVGGLFYLVTPTAALGQDGAPQLFASNVRYAVPVLALALALVPSHPFMRRSPARCIAGGALATTLAVAQFSAGPFPGWPDAHRLLGFLVGAGIIVGTVVARRAPRVALASAVLLGGAVAYPIAHQYDVRRYANDPVAEWADGVHGVHIAIAGFGPQLPLFGRDLSNHVQYVGQRGAHGAFHESPSCSEWRRALRQGDYRYVVVAPLFPGAASHEVAWTASDPAASVVVTSGPTTVYRFDRRVADPGC